MRALWLSLVGALGTGLGVLFRGALGVAGAACVSVAIGELTNTWWALLTAGVFLLVLDARTPG